MARPTDRGAVEDAEYCVSNETVAMANLVGYGDEPIAAGKLGRIVAQPPHHLLLATSGMLARLPAALAERRRLERELAEGGMATVFLAQEL